MDTSNTHPSANAAADIEAAGNKAGANPAGGARVDGNQAVCRADRASLLQVAFAQEDARPEGGCSAASRRGGDCLAGGLQAGDCWVASRRVGDCQYPAEPAL